MGGALDFLELVRVRLEEVWERPRGEGNEKGWVLRRVSAALGGGGRRAPPLVLADVGGVRAGSGGSRVIERVAGGSVSAARCSSLLCALLLRLWACVM